MDSKRAPTFKGRVIWLTPEQGGRTSGPPATSADKDYAATAFVPPNVVHSGLASFVLRAADRMTWTSDAEGWWLVPQEDARFEVRPGSIVVITEGPKVVAYFHVESIQAADSVDSDR